MGRRDQTADSTARYLKRAAMTEWKTALYARLSDENNGVEDDRSLQNQIRYLEDHIEKHPDLTLVDRYVDNGSSGMNFQRPQFQRMMEDVKSGRINCILVKDLSRFGRNHIEAGCYLEKIFPQLDVRFISVNDGYDSLDEARTDSAMVPLKNIINEMYARDTRRKVLATLRAREQKGERAFGRAPYGYRIDPACGYHLLPDPETADYVRAVFRLRAEGIGCTGIADWLNRMGAPTPAAHRDRRGQSGGGDGRRWNYVGVLHILKNRTYTGATVYNTSGQGEYRVIPGTHEALVTPEAFEAIRAEMERAGQKKAAALQKGAARAEQSPNILQGLFYCGECGRAMLYDRTGNSGVLREFRYRCSGYSRFRRDDADAPPCAVKLTSVPEQVVYKFLLDQARKQLRAGLALERLLGEDARTKKRRAAALKGRQTALKRQLRRRYEDYVNGSVTETEYAESRTVCQEKIEKIQEQLAAEAEKADNDPWAELKERVFADVPDGEREGIVPLTSTSCVEILEDDRPDPVEWLLRRGLTRELAEALFQRLEYRVDGSFSVTFRGEDYAEKLRAKRTDKGR
ncbi:MAG: recombinase family protein [Clostridiales bacterium]|nr:recombinase family protein [Clostridiales bacterium]